MLPTDWREQVRSLAEQRDAVILAHNYQLPEIQDVADHVGDSLGLSRVAAAADASTIVFCGVHFMAETAKILSYDKTVLIPDERAGCSLADTITADQLRAWKAEHPGAVVVSYVNTTAAVKAETDICCTSSNAVDVVQSIPADTEVLFCPDQFLGAHVQRLTGRENMHIWLGECHVHAGINGADLKARVAEDPDAELFIHPECGCATSALYLVGAGVVPETRTQDPVDERHGRQRPATRRREGARRHRDRHAPPADEGQPARDVRAGQPGGRVQVHEDDHAGQAAALAARRRRRGRRSGRHRRARPAVGRADDRHRHPVADRRSNEHAVMLALPTQLAAPGSRPGSATSTSSCSAPAPPASPRRSPRARCAAC